ncbi:hypothetical protein VH22019_00065 [Vibrio phage VH2_2019]|nr:hypothetical protein VH22019_00065 [Vibrio phage VH2_2019]
MASPEIKQKNIRWVSDGYAKNSLFMYTCSMHKATLVGFLESGLVSIQQNDPILMGKIVQDLKQVGIPVYGSMGAAMSKVDAL